MAKLIDCRSFRDRLEPLLAEELSAEERRALMRHVDGCADCAAVHAFDSGMRAAVARRLRRVPAPPGLETRVRAALDAATPDRVGVAWHRRPWFAALAASALLAALVLGGGVGGEAVPGAAGFVRVNGQRVTVVDRDCERAGLSLAEQRRCRNHRHLNMLRLAPGNYWFVSLDQDAGNGILFDPDLRGRQLVVDGELYRGIRTLRLTGYRRVEGVESPSPVPVSL